MTASNIDELELIGSPLPGVGRAVDERSSARPTGSDWAATRVSRETLTATLSGAPFGLLPGGSRRPGGHRIGVQLLLDWLEDQPGETWQDRWLASGADTAGSQWREIPLAWLRGRGVESTWHQEEFFRASRSAIGADAVRPSPAMLVAANFRRSALTTIIAQSRDPKGFSRLQDLCATDPDVSVAAAGRISYRAGMILAAKGGALSDITTGDVLELLEVEAAAHSSGIGAAHTFYRMLRTMGVFGDQAPGTLRELRSTGQLTPQELIGRYGIVCRPIRRLLVDYLQERQPALDYSSLVSLANCLGKLFWADLERHHPGIDNLHLTTEIAASWKQRLRMIIRSTRTADGSTTETATARVSYRESLTPVRAFYLDLSHWAVEDPSRWARWVAPCPIGREELGHRKDQRRRKARMDSRTRERLPVLPNLVRSVDEHRKHAGALLLVAQSTPAGESFTAAGQTLTRIAPNRTVSTKIWAQEPDSGRRRDLGREEDYAFWAFAAVEVLRATGIRIEELTELSHHSLVQYKLPTTGELVPLLQIAPSKTDTERLLVVSPELADVLSSIIQRVRGRAGTDAMPLVTSFDLHERRWSAPSPVLFQRRLGTEHRALTAPLIRTMLSAAVDRSGLTDAAGEPLRFRPHDFRRLFITDAVLSGLPPHIAQIIAGHRDINVTMGYKAVYPEEAIQAHLGFLARRRSLRPSEEYRTPTDQEWTQFLGHFEKRKVSTGTCGRAFGTPCIHEHACVRCPMLWPDPAQRNRLIEIRDNLIARIIEAKREGWLGEVDGLQISLTGVNSKLAQIDARTSAAPVSLGIPTRAAHPAATMT